MASLRPSRGPWPGLPRASARRWRLTLALVALLVLFSSASCADPEPWDADLRRISKPYRFSFVRWELEQFAGLLRPVETPAEAQRDPAAYVQAYLAREAQARALQQAGLEVPAALRAEIAEMRPVAERIVAEQVAAAYRAEGIRNPLDRHVSLPVTFPPVWFVFEPPPHLLVISPRDRIAPIRQVMLVPEMDVATMERIEAELVALNLAPLVTEIGGFGATYPAVVNTRTSLPNAIETVAEEWLHQYLAFTPTGYRYVLHLLRLRPDHEIAQINESLATVVHEEVGRRVLASEYGILPAPAGEPARPDAEPEFDFRAFMRETRLQAEALLERGLLEEAEAYMEARRQVVVGEGYRIRKLNQAYFAFYGTYADAPGAITPVGAELRALRAQSPSLSAFLNAAAELTSRDDLLRLLEQEGIGAARALPAR
jgi:hypothetical protein